MQWSMPSGAARRAVSLGAVAALCLTGVGAQASAAEGPPVSGATRALTPADAQPTLTATTRADKSPTAGLARTPASLRRATSPKLLPVLIKYDYDALASYTGTVEGYPATSPSVTRRPLGRTAVSGSRYLDYVRDQEATITRRVQAAAPRTEVTRRYRVVYGGVAALLPGSAVRRVLDVPGVVAVQRDAIHRPLTDSSPRFINATAAYRSLGTTRNAGKGILLGNLDTGVWPEHPSFADRGNLPAYDGPDLPCEFGDNPLTKKRDPFVCNDKLVGGAAFLDSYDRSFPDYSYSDLARDSEGHGSHTASTSAGDIVRNVHTIGPVLSRINGVAPGAQIMEYRVCGPEGCFSSDTTAAVEQAILDGVKVINFSISGGTNPATDATELAFLDAYNAGVLVAASAGNDGPSAGTANHVSPWVTSVAASTQSREFVSRLRLRAADGARFFAGARRSPGPYPRPRWCARPKPPTATRCAGSPHPPAPSRAGSWSASAARTPACPRATTCCRAGRWGWSCTTPRWPTPRPTTTGCRPCTWPTARALSRSCATTRRSPGGSPQAMPRKGRGDVLAAFSSRGPVGAFLKPDITAPGVQILGAMTPTPDSLVDGPPGEYFQAIAGTSMSAPHVAGAAILLAALHPDWTPGQIKSAMMTQAVTRVVKEDGRTPADPFDMGAGRVDVGAAARAPLTISDSAANMAAKSADPLRAIDLNLPSLNAPTMPGRVSTTRRVRT